MYTMLLLQQALGNVPASMEMCHQLQTRDTPGVYWRKGEGRKDKCLCAAFPYSHVKLSQNIGPLFLFF